MPEELVVRHCAPTLAGLKTASLFTVIPDSEEKLRRDVAELNDKLNGRRIHALVLGRFRNRARIYLYRPERLREDLHDDLAVQILCERGYDPDDLNQCRTCSCRNWREMSSSRMKSACSLAIRRVMCRAL
ncbi:MAG: DUF3793 family protein [Solobacterium sp.]|nr:DUF3793 family protein [Solobacterium sp.]